MRILIIIDMQNDFLTGTLGTLEAQAIISNVVKRIRESKDEMIIFTQDTHQEDYLTTPEGIKLPIEHCIEGTHGWEIHEEILNTWRQNKHTVVIPDVENNSFKKPVFGSVDLVKFLEGIKEDIGEIELIGVCTDICVVSNALMIKNTVPDIRIVVDAKCCAGVTPQSHIEALNVMRMCQIDVLQ